jgi:hypothetical protein
MDSITHPNKVRSKSIDDPKITALFRKNSFSPLKNTSCENDEKAYDNNHDDILPMGLASIGVTKKKRSNSIKARRSLTSSSKKQEELRKVPATESKFDPRLKQQQQQQQQPMKDLKSSPIETTNLRQDLFSSRTLISRDGIHEESKTQFYPSARQKSRSSSPSIRRGRNLSARKPQIPKYSNVERFSPLHAKNSLSPGRRFQRSRNSISRNRRTCEEDPNSDDSIDDDPKRLFQPHSQIPSRRKLKSFKHQSRSLSPCIVDRNSRRHTFTGRQGRNENGNGFQNIQPDSNNTRRSNSMDGMCNFNKREPYSNEISNKCGVNLSSSDELSLDALIQSKLNEIPALDFSRSRTVHIRATSERRVNLPHQHRSLSPCIRQGHAMDTYPWQQEMSRSSTNKDPEKVDCLPLSFSESKRDANLTTSSPNFHDYEMKLPSDDDSSYELPLSRYLKMVNESENSFSQDGSLNSDELARLLRDSSDLETFAGESKRDDDSSDDVDDCVENFKALQHEGTKSDPQGQNLNLIELFHLLKEDNTRDMPQHHISKLSESLQGEDRSTDDYEGTILTLEELADILNHVSSRHWSNKDIRWDIIAEMARGVEGDDLHPFRPAKYVGNGNTDEDDDSDVSSVSWDD